MKDWEEKTEEATPYRLQEVKRKGQVARSHDFSASLVLTAVLLYLYFQLSSLEQSLVQLFRWSFALGKRDLDGESLRSLGEKALEMGFAPLVPLFLLALVVGLTVNFLQTGFVFSLEPLKPRWDNLDPAKGWQRLFSRRSLVDLLKNSLKVILTVYVTWQMVKGQLPLIFLQVDMGLGQATEEMAKITFKVALTVTAISLGIGIGDYIFQRREFQKQIRMSRQEIKEEMKQLEGDPLVRSRLRERQRLLAKHRMMHAVPQATAVITNPTHLAVALRYRPGERAPRVVAKGAGFLAQRIKEIAEKHGVPVISDPPLAQALYRHVDLGEEIPVNLYQAVAEVLAYIYRLRGGF